MKIGPPAFDSVLRCPELLALILGSFSLANRCLLVDVMSGAMATRSEWRTTLAACARVCRAFSHHALDALWSALDDIKPLLELLPSLRNIEQTYVLASSSDPEREWENFKHYASRVRVLRYQRDLGTRIDASVWAYMAGRCGGNPLLPNLRTLDAQDISVPDITPLILLIPAAPCLRQLYLSFCDSAPSWVSVTMVFLFDSVVKTAGPKLEELTLYDEYLLPLSRIPSLKHCEHLQNLSLPKGTVLDVAAIRLIAQLESLTSLSITIRLGDSVLELGNGFPNLSTLYLSASTSDTAAFVAASHLTSISDFNPNITGSVDMAAFKICISKISKHLPQCLSNLNITARDAQNIPTHSVTELLSPSFVLQGLRHVDLCVGTSAPHVSDADLATIAKAWPELHCIGVNWGETPRPRYLASLRRPTVGGLAALARCCPKLLRITLPALETTRLPPVQSVPVLGRRLRILDLAWIPPGSSMLAIATALDRLFPTVERVTLATPGMEESGRAVLRYMKAMQTGREHARLRMLDPVDAGAVAQADSEELENEA
ncbi:hypothetical protein C8Q79DRAFT_1071946 [Trametes meyenii]|nr:hypothetical protein C8Q79DRAFT_1071946 [Trametes meyenii]